MADVLLSEEEQLILLKLESTYKVDAGPLGANALQVANINITALDGDTVARNNYRGFQGAQEQVRITKHVKIDFELELAGSGVVDTPVPYADLYKLTGHAQTITASTSVDYTLVSENYDSATIAYYLGPIKHTILGVRGSGSWVLNIKGLPVFKVSLWGFYVTPVNAGAPSGVDFSSILKPLLVSEDTVAAMTWFGITLKMEELTIEQGGNVAPEFLTSGSEVMINGRDAKVTMKIKEPNPDDINFWEKAEEHDAGPFAFTRGNSPANDGQIFTFAAANVSLIDVSRSFDNGTARLTLTGSIVPTVKNNDYTFATL
ncbi:MAG: hypothetical protein JKX92_12190 [Porticoccaceae bacterium]|nr:hypothetical protein [Porticoccaceae bacterium]